MKKAVKKKRGRPIGSTSSNPATKTLASVRVTPENLDKYKKVAAKSGKSFSAWVRGQLDKASK